MMDRQIDKQTDRSIDRLFFSSYYIYFVHFLLLTSVNYVTVRCNDTDLNNTVTYYADCLQCDTGKHRTHQDVLPLVCDFASNPADLLFLPVQHLV